MKTVEQLRLILSRQQAKPVFGICLGHQLLSLAAGATSYKMKLVNCVSCCLGVLGAGIGPFHVPTRWSKRHLIQTYISLGFSLVHISSFFAFVPLKAKDAVCNPVGMSVCGKPRPLTSLAIISWAKQMHSFLVTGV